MFKPAARGVACHRILKLACQDGRKTPHRYVQDQAKAYFPKDAPENVKS